MKICNTCKLQLPLSSFNKTSASNDGHDWRCRECNKVNLKRYYREDLEVRKSSRKSKKTLNNIKNRVWIYEYLENHPCPCGENRPECLEFDHIDPSTKKANISEMLSKSLSLKTIQEEILKCQVLCANCHRLKTAEQFGYYKYVKEARLKNF